MRSYVRNSNFVMNETTDDTSEPSSQRIAVAPYRVVRGTREFSRILAIRRVVRRSI